MSRKFWLLLAIAALLATSFAASVVAARRSSDNRVKYITRGLDYLHARQGDTGGFGSAENTAMAIMGAVASGERMGHSAWHVKGKNPFDYLQSTDLVAASTSIDANNNAPVYYARLIMAYVAMDRTTTIGAAGSKRVNLLNLLLSYQNTTAGSPAKGAFAPFLLESAIRTTSWAILAMHNAGVSQSDPAYPNYKMAEAWLAAQQNSNGGFPDSEQGGASDALDTALAYQALTVSSDGTDWNADLARSFLKGSQKASGGFSSTPNGKTEGEATSAAIQMIIVRGEDPDGAAWRVGIDTPVTALHHLQETDGSYRSSSASHLRPVIVTGWALVALNRKPFTTYPRNAGPAHKAFKFRPIFHTISPKNGAKFKTHIVLIRATYTDFFPKGTGIKPSASRLYVDDKNRSKPAAIGKYGLHLQLKNVANGDHTYRIELRDQAGNAKTVERKFTVAVPTPTPTIQPTTQPTVIPPVYPTHTATTKPYTPTPTPTTYPSSVSPYPYSPIPTSSAGPVVTGSPVPSPSTSASPAGAGAEGGGGSAAGFVGGTLLAMLPIGAAISYLLLHRKEELLDTASQGAVLAGGGSAWERFKHTLARSKDLTRPSSRE